MLLANNNSFKRNNVIIFEDLNISIRPNKIIHLKGNNGTGKTTLLKILANILKSNTGDIFWNGKNIKKDHYNFFKDLTFIMDKQIANNYLTVNENIFFLVKTFILKSKFKRNKFYFKTIKTRKL